MKTQFVLLCLLSVPTTASSLFYQFERGLLTWRHNTQSDMFSSDKYIFAQDILFVEKVPSASQKSYMVAIKVHFKDGSTGPVSYMTEFSFKDKASLIVDTEPIRDAGDPPPVPCPSSRQPDDEAPAAPVLAGRNPSSEEPEADNVFNGLEKLAGETLEREFKACIMEMPPGDRPAQECLSKNFFDKCFTGYLVRNKKRADCRKFFIGSGGRGRARSPECQAYMDTPYSRKISDCYYKKAKRKCQKSLDTWYGQNSLWKGTTKRQRIERILGLVEGKTSLLSQENIAHPSLDSSIVSCITRTETGSSYTPSDGSGGYYPETMNYTYCKQTRRSDGRPISSAHGIVQFTCSTFYSLRKNGVLPLQGLPGNADLTRGQRSSPEGCPKEFPDSEVRHFHQMGRNPAMQMETAVRYINRLLKDEESKGTSSDLLVERAVRRYDSDNPDKYRTTFLNCRRCVRRAGSREEKARCLLR